jgi:hypothetical protein
MAISATPISAGDVATSQQNGTNTATVMTQTIRLRFIGDTQVMGRARPASLTETKHVDIASDWRLSYSRLKNRYIPMGVPICLAHF